MANLDPRRYSGSRRDGCVSWASRRSLWRWPIALAYFGLLHLCNMSHGVAKTSRSCKFAFPYQHNVEKCANISLSGQQLQSRNTTPIQLVKVVMPLRNRAATCPPTGIWQLCSNFLLFSSLVLYSRGFGGEKCYRSAVFACVTIDFSMVKVLLLLL